MHHSYQFVSEQKYKPVKERLEQLIHKVQDELKNSFPFQYKFVGSAERDMITEDPTTNVGYDFDLNVRFENSSNHQPRLLKTTLMNAFNKYVQQFGYDFCEDSTRVITIKVKDEYNKKIVHSADFCIVQDLPNGGLQIIKYDKKQNSYYWEALAQYPKQLIDRANDLKSRGLWNQVKDLYLKKKNANIDPNVKSRSIYSMTINEMYKKHFS